MSVHTGTLICVKKEGCKQVSKVLPPPTICKTHYRLKNPKGRRGDDCCEAMMIKTPQRGTPISSVEEVGGRWGEHGCIPTGARALPSECLVLG